jgi:DNA-directed RNA polymerase subunit RPC12/RpoP
MKKSHIWDTLEQLEARCPNCGKHTSRIGCVFEEGTVVTCLTCGKKFELGKQK